MVKSEMRSVSEWMASADNLQRRRVSIDRGKHLALGGTDSIRIWRCDDEDLNAFDTRPLVSWRQPAEAEETDDNEALSEPSLSWSPDGERLGFAVERQVCPFRSF